MNTQSIFYRYTQYLARMAEVDKQDSFQVYDIELERSARSMLSLDQLEFAKQSIARTR